MMAEGGELNKDFKEASTKRDMEVDVDNEQVAEGEQIEEDDDDDDDDDVEEDGHTLSFGQEMNPLDFLEDDASGIQPYQQFERIEYETLAQRKRAALSHHLGNGLAKKLRQEDLFRASEEDISWASIEEILESMNIGVRRKLRKPKRRGRKKGSKNKSNPEITRKLGDATLHYSCGRYEEAISVLFEVVRLAPNLPDPFHILGAVFNAIGERKKALNCYMLAAHMTPKDSSLWKCLVDWSLEQGNTGQAMYCLSKAITADPDDIDLRKYRASLYIDRGDLQKAAVSYEQISRLCPDNDEALKSAAKLYQKCGQIERSSMILEKYIEDHPVEADLTVVDLLAAICISRNEYGKALHHIEHAHLVYCSGKELPLHLTIKAGICHIYLGNIDKAEVIFKVLQGESAKDHVSFIIEAADAFMKVNHCEYALKYLLALDERAGDNDGVVHLQIAHCYLSLKRRVQAIQYFYKALTTLEGNISARVTLATLLVEEDRVDDAISLLSPPANSDPVHDTKSEILKPWWLSGEVKLKLSEIYKAKGMLKDFVNAIFPLVHESLFMESIQQKVKAKKKLPRSVLIKRAEMLEDRETDNIFHGFRPVATPSDRLKATRAKKSLQKKAALKEEKKAAVQAAGFEWCSDDSDDEPPRQALKEPPLPNLFKEEEQQCLIVDLSKVLTCLQRHSEALEIINLTLRLPCNKLSADKREELRALGAQIAYNNIIDPTHGFDCVRYIVHQHPYSLAAWNCYYKVTSRLENRYSKHCKFLRRVRGRYKDCVPPIVISGHQFATISQHQTAAREYLEAYKLMPENPLINLCAGSALINLALGFRLQNKHQCLVQGLAFLYNNLELTEHSQEALYNIARAFHHVGLYSLAVSYYEQVLTTTEKDYPIPKLPNENPDTLEDLKPGYCSLRREAAYNLHLIYKKSGALDLARQVLKNHCTF